MKLCSHASLEIARRRLCRWVCWMSIGGFAGQFVSPLVSAEDPAKGFPPAKAAESVPSKTKDRAALGKGAGSPEKAEESTAPPELIQLFTDAANFQNNQAFDLAAEAWEKFLQKYPADSRAAEARYNLGMSQLQLANQPGEEQAKHFQRAVDTLTLVTQGSNKSLAEEAWLNLGLANYTWALNESEAEPKEERLRQCVAALSRYLSDFQDAGRKDQALFYLGECQYLQQDLPGALKSYAELVEEFPGSGLVPDGLYALGVALEETQDFSGAEGAFKKFLETQPDHTLVPEVMTRRAEALLQQKKFAEAAQEFELAAKKPDYLQADHALFRAAYCWASLDDFRRGAETFSQLVRDFSASPLVAEATIAAARSYYRVPDLEAARGWYEKAFHLEGSPQAVVLANEAAHWLNRDALQARRSDEVLQRVEGRLPFAQPTDYLVHLRLDRADAWYQNNDDKLKAVSEYEAIAKEFPEHYLTPRALYNAAYAYLEKGDFEKAREIANTPLPRAADQPVTPLEAELRSVAAESALQVKQFEQAEKLFAELRETGPEAYRSYWGVRQALAMNLANQHEAAIKILDEVSPSLKTTAHQAEGLYVRGLCQLALDNATGAEESLTKSLASDRNWKQADEALFALARVQRITQGTAVARKTLSDLFQEFPQSAVLDECHLRWADYAYADRVYSESIEHYQEVLAKWPASTWIPFAYYGLGWSQLGTNQSSAARDSFASLMDKFPDHPLAIRALYARGVAGQKMGEYESSRTDLDQFTAENPTEEHAGEALYLSSVCSSALKQPDRAVASLQRLLKDYPEYHRTDRALYDLAWAFKESKQPEASLQQFQALAEKNPTSPFAVEALYHLAENDYALAKYEDAAQRYVIVQSHPALADNPELGEKATYKLAWCDFQIGKFEQARDKFESQIKQFPTGTLLQDADFMVGECYFNLHEYAKALEHYQRLKVDDLRTEIRPTMYLHSGQSSAQLKRWEESLKFLVIVPEKFPDSSNVHQANYEIAWAYHQTGRRDEAIRAYQNVADVARNAIGARARFMIGELLFEQKQYAKAVQEFQKVMYGYGGNDAPEPLQVWQAKAGFEAGQCATAVARLSRDAVSKQRWTAEALKAFQYVVKSHPQSEEAENAKQRISQLSP